MAQQYLPMNYGAPRYASQSLGVPYVSAYDPSTMDKYGGLMQQEYGKAMAANQAMAAREGEQGDIYSEDLEGKEQVIGNYKRKLEKIKEAYNQDLALAAPELSRAIMEERSNPWYAKNVKYNEESQRRQKLLDQYGPNINFFKDLPQGNLNNMEMEDIGFDYYNRAMLDQQWKEKLGNLAQRKGDLKVSNLKDFPAFVKTSQQLGLDDNEAQSLWNGSIDGTTPVKDMTLEMLEGMGIEPTEENIAMIEGEFRNWAPSNLVRGAQEGIQRNMDYDASGGGFDFTKLGLPAESGLFEKGAEGVGNGQTRQEAVEKGLGELKEDPDNVLSEAFINNLDMLTGGRAEDRIEATRNQLLDAADNRLLGRGSSESTVKKALKDNGILDGTPTVKSGANWAGEQISYEEYRKNIDTLIDEYKNIKSYIHSGSGRSEARAAAATPSTETPILGILPEYQGKAQSFFKTSLFSGNAENLFNYGVRIQGKEGRKSKTTNLIKDISDGDTVVDGIDYVASSSKGTPGYFKINAGDEVLEVPMKGKRGESYAMELSVMLDDSRPVNDTFNYMYDNLLEKGENSIPIEQVLKVKLPGFSTMERITENGQMLYSAYSEEAGMTFKDATPNGLLQKVTRFNYMVAIKSGDEKRVKVLLNDPNIEYLTRIIRKNYTPKDIKEMTAEELITFMNLQL